MLDRGASSRVGPVMFVYEIEIPRNSAERV